MHFGVRVAAVLIAFGGAACANRPGAVSAPSAGVAAGVASAPARPTAQTPADITAHATPAIVTVRAGNSLGTGFVVRKDGWIATNFHVVRGATEVSVEFSNHHEFPVVEIMNANRLHDLVILRIEATNLPILTIGDSDRVRPGDSVLAIGHPLGLEDTVSNGLISAVRDVHAGLRVLQISAPIAPGSSGGPLFNDRGEVIGVATAVSTSGQNLNFGLPSKYVSDLVDHPHPISMDLFVAAMAAMQQQAEPERQARNIPHHPLSVLSGCSDANKALIFRTRKARSKWARPCTTRATSRPAITSTKGRRRTSSSACPRLAAAPSTRSRRVSGARPS